MAKKISKILLYLIVILGAITMLRECRCKKSDDRGRRIYR